MIFRNYQENDFQDLKQMIFNLYEEDSNPFEEEDPMTENKILKTVQRTNSHPEQVQITIFEIDNVVVGYALITFFWSNEYGGIVAILDELYVLHAYRSKGISTNYLTLLAKNKDYKIVHLEVFKENTRALQLYQKMGFEIVDRYFMNKIV